MVHRTTFFCCLTSVTYLCGVWGNTFIAGRPIATKIELLLILTMIKYSLNMIFSYKYKLVGKMGFNFTKKVEESGYDNN